MMDPQQVSLRRGLPPKVQVSLGTFPKNLFLKKSKNGQLLVSFYLVNFENF